MAWAAEIDGNGVVVRVIVGDPAWAAQHLGGTWVPAAKYDNVETYPAPGLGHDDTWPERFAPPWVQPLGSEDAYPQGSLVFHNGRIWKSTTPANVWEPGVSGWRDVPPLGYPMWVQPTGAHDAYGLGDRVTYNGSDWESQHAANVWVPGVFGWVVVP